MTSHIDSSPPVGIGRVEMHYSTSRCIQETKIRKIFLPIIKSLRKQESGIGWEHLAYYHYHLQGRAFTLQGRAFTIDASELLENQGKLSDLFMQIFNLNKSKEYKNIRPGEFAEIFYPLVSSMCEHATNAIMMYPDGGPQIFTRAGALAQKQRIGSDKLGNLKKLADSNLLFQGPAYQVIENLHSMHPH